MFFTFTWAYYCPDSACVALTFTLPPPPLYPRPSASIIHLSSLQRMPKHTAYSSGLLTNCPSQWRIQDSFNGRTPNTKVECRPIILAKFSQKLHEQEKNGPTRHPPWVRQYFSTAYWLLQRSTDIGKTASDIRLMPVAHRSDVMSSTFEFSLMNSVTKIFITRMHSTPARNRDIDLPDRDPCGQRPPRQRPPWTETTPVNRITDRCKNITLPQLHCVR